MSSAEILRGRDILASVVDQLDVSTETTHPEITVGEAAVLVELCQPDEAIAGVAHRPPDDDDVVNPSLKTLLGWATAPPDSIGGVRKAAGVAAVNALSAPRLEWQHGDPMVGLPPSVEEVATVGLFGPALHRFEEVTVRIIERDPIEAPPTPDGVDVLTYEPAAADQALSGVDVVFVTGSTLLYGGVDRYLRASPSGIPVVLVGATASFLPAPAFDAGVTVLAGAEVTDREAVREAVVAGACGSGLHDAGLRKGCISAASEATVSSEAETDISSKP